jgi:predicted nucleic acid-binding protein
MAASVLADTGAILAILDRDDRWHRKCVDALKRIPLPLLTSEAVLTELFHLTDDKPHEVEPAWRFVRSGHLILSPITDADLPFLHALMSRYADRPMDFADATLVHLAQRESLSTIFSIDHDDFETYRIGGRGRFRIIPAR